MPRDKYIKLFLTFAPIAVLAFVLGLLADRHWFDSEPIGTCVGVLIAVRGISAAIKSAYTMGQRDGSANPTPPSES